MVQLSRTVSQALRHDAKAYNLVPDAEGWVNVVDLIKALQNHGLPGIEEKDILLMIKNSEKTRHQILNGRIRALYGHSIEQSVVKVCSVPPKFLYHGTSQYNTEDILKDGLVPMRRQFVHLSEEVATAKSVGRRKGENVAILTIRALEAHQEGIVFYNEGKIWLTKSVPTPFISKVLDEAR